MDAAMTDYPQQTRQAMAEMGTVRLSDGGPWPEIEVDEYYAVTPDGLFNFDTYTVPVEMAVFQDAVAVLIADADYGAIYYTV